MPTASFTFKLATATTSARLRIPSAAVMGSRVAHRSMWNQSRFMPYSSPSRSTHVQRNSDQ